MKYAMTFIRFSRKKEYEELECRLKSYAEMAGYSVVWQECLRLITSKIPVDEIIINTLNDLCFQDIKVDAILVVRYDHIHRKFTQTAKLIKSLSHYGVRIISIEETVDENDLLFTDIYYSNLKS